MRLIQPYIITAHTLDEVVPALEAVEAAASRGLRALGFVAYEAAPAFDAHMITHAPVTPLAWFLVAQPEAFVQGLVQAEAGRAFLFRGNSFPRNPTWAGETTFTPGLSAAEHAAAIESIRAYLQQGHTYQVNYTFPLEGQLDQDALLFFHALCAAQGAGEYYYFDTGAQKILCASPELFFSLEHESIVMRPMKGTRARGRWLEEDQDTAQELLQSEKDQAENVMIVDMIRNDLGRIAEAGSVQVDQLFQVERYETVWQMTSQVSAQTGAALPEIFRALFPCASVTGAPKLETMRIIHELEPQARGVYCGAAGWYGPGRHGRFSVAIRTAIVDTHSGRTRYPVGSGITWGSVAEAEYAECLQKAAVLTRRRPDFELLETLRWEESGFFLLDLHLERMRKSAAYFGFRCEESRLREALGEGIAANGSAQDLGGALPKRVRLLLSRNGTPRVELHPLGLGAFAHTPSEARNTPVSLALASAPIAPEDIFLYHKTTHRAVYENLRCPGFDDVLLWNPAAEITESTIANVVLQDEAGFWTPPRVCGLLGGTFREHLLREGVLRERVITVEEAHDATLWLINSVRGWLPAALPPQ